MKTERVLTNPLAKLDMIEVRGKTVRASRAFTEEELQRLFAAVGKRRLAYQLLLYTGQRKSEVQALVWSDLHLDESQPFILFRADTTKDKDKRAVPLRAELAEELRRTKPEDVEPTKKVFNRTWPTYDTLRADLKRAGIEWKDSLGRVVHFHSFRKTWQTLGVRYGINQRAAQEVLGHLDANLTAKVYTDVPALALHDEVAKLPRISRTQSTHIRTQKSGNPGHLASLAGILDELTNFIQAVKIVSPEGIGHDLTLSVTSVPNPKLGAGAGLGGQRPFGQTAQRIAVLSDVVVSRVARPIHLSIPEAIACRPGRSTINDYAGGSARKLERGALMPRGEIESRPQLSKTIMRSLP